MFRRISQQGIVFILCTHFFYAMSFAQNTLHVPSDYSSIEEALQMTNQGDTVMVAPGTYYETFLWPSNAVDVKLLSSKGPEETTISGALNTFSARVIIFLPNQLISPNTVIDGFTLTGGKGGGIEVRFCSPSLKNLNVYSNHVASWEVNPEGAGMYLWGSNSIVENCDFYNNTLSSDLASGAGLKIWEGSPIIKNCSFRNNRITDDGSGGAMAIYGATNCIIQNCIIEDNATESAGSSAMSLWQCPNVELLNLVVSGNTNYSNFEGSYIRVTDSKALIKNCTFTQNKGGIFASFDSEIEIINSILYANGSEEIDGDGNFKVSYSLIDGELYPGQGNITGNPDFLSDDVFIPIENSICTNAGNPSESPNIDILENQRPIPEFSRPDLGAYEVENDYKYVLLQTFLDENENGLFDNNESFVGLGSYSHNDSENYINVNPEGVYLNLTTGVHNFAWLSEDVFNPWEITTSNELSIEVGEDNYSGTILFGIKPTREIKKLKIGSYVPILVCNNTLTIDVNLSNLGTTIESGYYLLEIDESIEDFQVLGSQYILNGNIITWEFDKIIPGESIQRKVEISVPGITEETLNDELVFNCKVLTPDQPGWIEEFYYADIIRCAYDPNDKLVYPHRDDDLALIEEDLLYTIRFQNVGNFYAENVVIVDTLDNNLDISTFNFLGTSHPENLRLSFDNDILNFEFNQIFLPDSTTNLEGSHGYVMYSIQVDTTIEEYSIIENTGHIYFDFNEAIITNTTKNIMVEEFPTVDTNDENILMDIEVYPNPSNGKFFFSSQLSIIELYDFAGNLLITEEAITELDLSNMTSGIYLARIAVNEKVGYLKLILNN